jgi:rhodanese-related sulfurtransferase
VPIFANKSLSMTNAFLPVLFLLCISCNAQQPATAKMKPEDFEKAISFPAIQVLDVRTADEYKSGHIKNSLQADWANQQQFNDRVQHIDREKPVYIYCLAGGRSNAAANWMRSNGYKNVIELEGGINAWKRDNKPLEGNSNEPQLTLEEYTASIPTDKTVLVDFGATWCPPCVKMVPVLDEIQKDKEVDFTFIKIDAGVHTNLMKALNIEPIPLFIIYKNGKETWRKQGLVSKEELLAQLK